MNRTLRLPLRIALLISGLLFPVEVRSQTDWAPAKPDWPAKKWEYGLPAVPEQSAPMTAVAASLSATGGFPIAISDGAVKIKVSPKDFGGSSGSTEVGAAFDSLVAQQGFVAFFDSPTMHLSLYGETKAELIPGTASEFDALREQLQFLGVYAPGGNRAVENKKRGIKLEFVSSTGRILIQGPPRFIVLAKSLMGTPQQTSTPYIVQRIPLRYAFAEDIVLKTSDKQEIKIPGVLTMLRRIIKVPSEGYEISADTPVNSTEQSGLAGGGTRKLADRLEAAIAQQQIERLVESESTASKRVAEDVIRTLAPVLNERMSSLPGTREEPFKVKELVPETRSSTRGQAGGAEAHPLLPAPDFSPRIEKTGRTLDAIIRDTPNLIRRFTEDDTFRDVDWSAMGLADLGQPKEFAKASVTGSQPIFEMDTRTNSILVFASEKELPVYRSLIEALDQQQLLVEISVSIIDINEDSTYEWNSQLAGTVKGEIQDQTVTGVGGFDGGSLLRKTTANENVSLADHVVTSLAGSLLPGTGASVSTLVVGESYRILSRLRALETEGKARFVSRPSLLTVDNSPGSLSESSRFFVPVAGKEDADIFEIVATTSINVRPRILFPPDTSDPSQARVRLFVSIEDANVDTDEKKTTTTVTQSGEIITVPAVTNSHLVTQGEVGDGQSLLLGGRYRTQEIDIDGHVPILGKIPLLGLAFKGKRVAKQRVQRLFMLTPKIINPQDYHRQAEARMNAILNKWNDEQEKKAGERRPATSSPATAPAPESPAPAGKQLKNSFISPLKRGSRP